MNFTLSAHARTRMQRDGVDVDDIDLVLTNPQWNVPTTRGERYDAIVRGRRLAVVLAEGRNTPHVVTVFWTGTRRA